MLRYYFNAVTHNNNHTVAIQATMQEREEVAYWIWEQRRQLQK